jgi:hypothetical protein
MLTGFFGSIASGSVKNPNLWGPMINFSLSNATTVDSENIIARDLIALIDTGSDLAYPVDSHDH